MALSCCPTGGSIIPHNLNFECDKIPKKLSNISPPSSSSNGFDDVDNPNKGKNIDTSFEDYDLFKSMQYEKNRWDSFDKKWPLTFINIEELVESGFFYLQSDDKVQCAFCKLILHDWKNGDKPLEEHAKSSSTCPFLKKKGTHSMAATTSRQYLPFAVGTSSISLSCPTKPKNPRMVDLRMRLLTFKNWPHPTIKIQDLAECGLYYTGVQDVVTCFHCGGSLSNWEPNDEPIVEHAKFYNKCDHLRIIQNRPFYNATKSAGFNTVMASQNGGSSTLSQQQVRDALNSDIVKKAKEIFPPSMVDEVVTKHLQKGEVFTSLHHLCEKVLMHPDGGLRQNRKRPEVKNSTLVPKQESISASSSFESSNSLGDVLLCKICMDSEREVVFQPCGHLISCEKCSTQLTKCPLCRKHIVSTMRTFLS